jgi:hypothetical protein
MRTQVIARAVLFLFFVGFVGPAGAVVNALNSDSAIGINLEWNRFEKPRVAFANALKSARKWQQTTSGGNCGSGGSYSGTIDSNGYPTQFGSRECIFTELFEGNYSDGAWPIGEWVLRWDGDATFGVGKSASGYTTTGPGRATFDVAAGNQGIRIQIESIPSSVSNVRAYPPGGVCYDGAEPIPNKFCSTARCQGGACNDAPGCDGAETCVDLEVAGEAGDITFHPLWVSRLGQYRILRFMNWLHTNHSRVEDFSEWLPESNYTWSYDHDPLGAVPLSVIAKLCNTVNAACYVNVPSLATDAHITQFAEFFRDNVNDHLPVYLEYSNEVWNPGFEQHDKSSQQAYELWQSDPSAFDGADCEDVEPNSPSEFDCANHWHGKRTYEMCALAQAAFDAVGQGDRLVCVSGRRISPSGSELGRNLDCERWTAAPNGNCYTGSDIDVVAVNVYFGNGEDDCGSTQQAACDGAMVDENRKLCDGPGCPVTELSAALASRGLSWPLMVYEGGSHLNDSSSEACVDLTINANSCIGDVYDAALDDWRDLDVVEGYNLEAYIFFDQSGRQSLNAGGNLFGHRGSNEGQWPKERALLDWDSAPGNECWWPNCELDTVPEPGLSAQIVSGLLLLAALARSRKED